MPPETKTLSLLPQSVEQRRVMVDRQVRTFDVTDQIVVGRMLDVPRELFVDARQSALTYSDLALDLDGSDGTIVRTLLAPFVVARMMQAAAPVASDRVLDLAGGTGYTAALFAGLTQEVVAVESDAALSGRSADAFATLGLANVQAVHAPLAARGRVTGLFDIIFINGAVEAGLAGLSELLTPTGRIYAIVPKPSGALMAAQIAGRGDDLSVRPLFDAQARMLAEFRQAPAFAF